MTLNISVPTSTEELRPKITVIGVGGAGGNAVNNMISAKLEGVDFLVANTDGQALANSLAERKIQLGRQHTQGLGAGSKPDIGRIAAEESIDDILAELADSHMVFITAGMGGGTGTGAAAVIAKAARERGILTVGVVTKPFDFEGGVRMKQANAGIEELQAYVDTLIIIPNQNLFRLANERTTFADAFAMADEVLHQGVCGVTDLMIKPGLINLDFADIRTVMSEMGKAMMGTGEASGDNRATNAAEAAINNPLLDETTMKGAQAVLINITGGSDMTLFEVDEAANHIRREVDSEATIIFGSALDERMEGIMRVSVVATGMEAATAVRPQPMPEIAMKPLVSATPSREAASVAPEPTAPVAEVASPAPIMRTMTGLGAETAAVDTTEERADETSETATADDFAFSPEPPVVDEGETTTSAEDTYFSDDPDQHNLMDIVGAAPQDTDTESKATAEAGEDKQDAPFILKDTVDPEETPELTADVVKPEKTGLMRNLSRIFVGKEPAEAKTEAREPSVSARRDQVTILEPVMTTAAAPEADQPAETETTAAAEVAVDAPTEPAPAASEPVVSMPGAESQLDITPAEEDVDLEIPAFLRRQAN